MYKIKHLMWGAALALSATLPIQAMSLTPSLEGSEMSLRVQMQESVWPQDVAKSAQAYLDRYPQGVWADAARSMMQRANASAELMQRNDIHLYFRSVVQTAERSTLRNDVRSAMLGDAQAAVRVAHSLRKDQPSRYVGWLQWASALGHEKAAYELALFYRVEGQPVVASQYETRAVQLGYVLPVVLDHVRK
jgi:hypothetical protein